MFASWLAHPWADQVIKAGAVITAAGAVIAAGWRWLIMPVYTASVSRKLDALGDRFARQFEQSRADNARWQQQSGERFDALARELGVMSQVIAEQRDEMALQRRARDRMGTRLDMVEGVIEDHAAQIQATNRRIDACLLRVLPPPRPEDFQQPLCEGN